MMPGLLPELLNSTFFLPVDGAFDALPQTITLDQLINENTVEITNFIRKLVLFNVVSKPLSSDNFQDGRELRTALNGITSNATSEEADGGRLKLVLADGQWSLVGGKSIASVKMSLSTVT